MEKLFEAYLMKSNNDFIYMPIEQDMEVLIYYFDFGFCSDELKGYAHLLEHMIIRINQEVLTDIKKRGIQFNAVTKENMTIYTFLNFRNNDFLLHCKPQITHIFDSISKFNNELFELEKKTIQEELAIVSNQVTAEVASRMLGTETEIKNFTLDKMLKIFKEKYQNIHTVYMGKIRNVDLNKFIPVYKKASNNIRQDIVLRKKGLSFELDVNQESELFLYCLHICEISQVTRQWKLSVEKNNKIYTVSIDNSFYLPKKEHIYTRYCLLCANLKVYMDEMMYLVSKDLLGIDIKQVFFSEWEVII